MRPRTIVFLLTAVATLSACHDAPPVPTVPRYTDAPLELTLRTSAGHSVDLGDYRGAPVLIALLGTYDTASQAAIESVQRFARHHEDVFVIGILAQQGADLLIEPYASAANASFPIAYDPSGTLLEGRTAMGAVESVPSFVTLDANGVVAAKHNGFVSDRQLDTLIERARMQAAVRPVEAPPLLGRPH